MKRTNGGKPTVVVGFRNARRSGSTPMEWYLEQAGFDVVRMADPLDLSEEESGWKHGLLPPGIGPDARVIVLSKHPLAWLRSRVRWALPTPRFSPINPVLHKAFEVGKKAACSVAEPARRLLYSPMLDAWFRGYAYWFEALPAWIHVRHIDLLRRPQAEWERVCRFLGVEPTEFELSGKQINPNADNGSKGPTGTGFDPTFYTERRWRSWFTETEVDWISQYVRSKAITPIIEGMGYEIETASFIDRERVRIRASDEGDPEHGGGRVPAWAARSA